jgi:hypothetical protein
VITGGLCLHTQENDMEHHRRIPSPGYLLLSLIAGLSRQEQGRAIPLKSYLESLRLLARPWSTHEALPFADFVELLCMAFVPVAAYDATHGHAVYTFIAWERRITRQIRDLSEMREASTLDPRSYLKRAVASVFSEWHESHDMATTSREITWRQFEDFLKAGQGYGNHLASRAIPYVDLKYQRRVVPSFDG